MIKVIQELHIYEKDSKEVGPKDEEVVMVNSHWNRNNMVVIAVGDHRYTVAADDLRSAIDNATNTAR